jgi:hypothetical protein
MSVWDPLHNDPPRIEADSTKSIGIAAPTPSKSPPPSKWPAPPPFLPAGPGDLNAGRSRLPHCRPGPTRPHLLPRPTLGPASPIAAVVVPVGRCRRAPCSRAAPSGSSTPSGPVLPSCSLRELDARRAPSSRAAPSGSSTPSGPLLPSCSLRGLDTRRAPSSRARAGRELANSGSELDVPLLPSSGSELDAPSSLALGRPWT